MKNIKLFESFVNERLSKSELSKIQDYLYGQDIDSLREICDELLIDDEDYAEDKYDLDSDDLTDMAMDYIESEDIKLKDVKSIIESNTSKFVNEADLPENIELDPDAWDLLIKAVSAGFKNGLNGLKKMKSKDHTSLEPYAIRNSAEFHGRLFKLVDKYEDYAVKVGVYNNKTSDMPREWDLEQTEKLNKEFKDYAEKVIKGNI